MGRGARTLQRACREYGAAASCGGGSGKSDETGGAARCVSVGGNRWVWMWAGGWICRGGSVGVCLGIWSTRRQCF